MSLGLRNLIGGLFDSRASSMKPVVSDRRRDVRAAVDREVRLEWRDEDGWRVEPVESVDSSATGMGVLTETPLRVGDTVYVLEPDQAAVQAHVCNCEPVGESYRIGLAMIRRERRRTPRLTAGGAAHVRWTGRGGAAVEAEATVRNAGDGGLQLRIDRAVEEGSVLRLTGAQIECMATVRYSIPHGDDHLVGVEILGDPFEVAAGE